MSQQRGKRLKDLLTLLLLTRAVAFFLVQLITVNFERRWIQCLLICIWLSLTSDVLLAWKWTHMQYYCEVVLLYVYLCCNWGAFKFLFDVCTCDVHIRSCQKNRKITLWRDPCNCQNAARHPVKEGNPNTNGGMFWTFSWQEWDHPSSCHGIFWSYQH